MFIVTEYAALNVKVFLLVHVAKSYPVSYPEEAIWNSIQLFHNFLCNSQNYHPLRGDRFDCCTEKYELVVL